jgi:hypothetical protein
MKTISSLSRSSSLLLSCWAGLWLACAAPRVGAADLSSNFDAGAEDWRASDTNAMLTWQNTGGVPDGYLSGRRAGSTNTWYFVSPTNWAGDWSSYKVLKFDFSIPTRHYPDADRAGMVVIVGTNGTQMVWTASTPLWTWTHYEVSLTPAAFGVDQATYDAIMASVAELRILAEFTTATETVGLDNVLVTAAPPVAQTDLVSRFTDGTIQGWRPVDDVTLTASVTGQPSFGLYANDWMDGRTYRIATPTNWAGDWRAFKELSFDMRWSGANAAGATPEIVRIFGANGQTLIWSGPLTNGVWMHRQIALLPESFGVAQAEFDGVMSHVSEMWIRGEFGSSDDLTYLDNVMLTANTNGPPVRQNLISRFDADAEGWVGFDNATTSWDATNGISGGAFKSVDGGGGTARFQSPDAWSGDWRAFKTLRFMLRIAANKRADFNSTIWIVNWSGSALSVTLPRAFHSWTPYTLDLTPETFGVGTNEFDAVLRDVACLWINADLLSGTGTGDTTWLDNVMLLTESGPGLPPDHVSTFDADREGWRYGGWTDTAAEWSFSGLAPWYATGGNPDGHLENTDTAAWTCWLSPENWAGDWRGLRSVSFDFKIITGTSLFNTWMITLCSAWTNLHASVTNLPVPGQWMHYEFALTPTTFGVSTQLFEQVLQDTAFLGIRSEWIDGTNEREALDNFRLSKGTDAYWDWIDDYFSGAELANEDIAGEQADPDGDGVSNWNEFIAGTDPTDEDDLLRIERVSVAGTACRLDFKSKTNRLYDVLSTPALPASNTWSSVTNDIPGNGLLLSVPVPVGSTEQFYRLQVRRSE